MGPHPAEPIYYFSGTDDPNTPPWQATAHFDAQVNAPRQLVHIADGGHNPRIYNFTDCSEALWAAMATATGFEAALATCSWPYQHETADGGSEDRSKVVQRN